MAYRDGTQSGAGLGRNMSREEAMAMIAAQDGQFGQNRNGGSASSAVLEDMMRQEAIDEARYADQDYMANIVTENNPDDSMRRQQMASQQMDRFGMSPGSQNQAIYGGPDLGNKRPLSPLAQWAMEQSMYDPKQELAQKEQEDAVAQQQLALADQEPRG